MDPSLLIIRALGFVAVGAGVYAYFRTTDDEVKRMMAVSSLFWVAYNGILGAITAATIGALSMTRQIVSSKVKDESWSTRLMHVFSVLNTGVLALTWHGWISLFPYLGSQLSNYAMFRLRFERLRIALLCSALLWAVSALYFHAYEALLATAISCAVIVYRFRRTKLDRLLHERRSRPRNEVGEKNIV